MNTTDTSIRLLAAKVLTEGPYKHTNKSCIDCVVLCDANTDCPPEMTLCAKCNQPKVGDCLIPDLPTEPLEVLARRCLDNVPVGSMDSIVWDLYTEVFPDQDFSLALAYRWFALRARPEQQIQAAAMAKGII